MPPRNPRIYWNIPSPIWIQDPNQTSYLTPQALLYSLWSQSKICPKDVDSTILDAKGIKRIQAIVGVLIFNGWAVDKKVWVDLNTICTQHASSTESTNKAIDHLLDYLATYLNDGIVYRFRKIVLAAQSDSGFHIESKGWSRAGAHVFLAEDETIPRWSGPILTIAQVITFVMWSEAEDELGAIFITTKELVPMRQSLIDMGWPQLPTHIQTDNSIVAGAENETIIAQKTKYMDLRFHCLRCCEARQQFRFYWAPVSNNWAGYSTKHHP